MQNPSFLRKFRSLILPASVQNLTPSLLYWQYEFFYILSVFCVIGGSVAFMFGLVSYIREGYIFMIPVISILFAMLVGLAFFKKIDFHARRVASATIFLLFGIYFLSVKGFQGLGLSFLLAYPIVTGILLGNNGALISLAINFLVLAAVNLLLYFVPSIHVNFTALSRLQWLAISVTFMGLSMFITISVSRLLKGLADSLITETISRQKLEIEITQRKDLEEALSIERTSLQKRVEERTLQLSASNMELQEAMKFKDMFLANVSHELRTPIHAITGYSHLLKKSGEETFTPKQQTYLDRLDESSDHLLQVINDILDITRFEAGKLVLRREVILLQETCAGAANYLRPDAVKKNIQVNINFVQAITTILADPQRFKQILINLLSNAVKFTSENGLVGITVDREANETLIEIWDTGIGIADDERMKIFNPFYRSNNAFTENVQGTGLGLPLVKNLVEAHGWRIDFESKLNEGSSFIIFIPDEINLALDEPA